MRQIITKQWFLICLMFFIGCGLLAGFRLPHEQVTSLIKIIDKRFLVGFVLFLMAFTLDSHQLVKSIRFPMPVLWATVVNAVAIPLLGWLMMPWQLTVDFQFGLMIAVSVPCTMAAASVWTRKANGNDAISLMVTLITNGFCFLIAPFWLKFATSHEISVSTYDLMIRLVMTALIPMMLGQIFRQFSIVETFATKRKTEIGVTAQLGVLVIVFIAGCTAGQKLNGNGNTPAISAVLFVLASVILIHLSAMGIGYLGSKVMRFAEDDRTAILFASSQKTLPIGLLIATSVGMFGNPDLLGAGKGIPFALLPIMMYHASQLFIDTLIAGKIAQRKKQDTRSI